ncbi:hypothetical protein INT44_005265 [Umbelopsis vinacea]|uniref:Uncharacterized protein n=1 Tax=Umbelopsis vinacea TaxID=44442 RepID=A0A8H7QA28_9FUNG|nr:hypothetical protein INT44_005265 [Umbelopsis vinacea]
MPSLSDTESAAAQAARPIPFAAPIRNASQSMKQSNVPRRLSRQDSMNPRRLSNASQTAESVSPSVSWPIVLAIVPTLGAFVAGSAEVWSDLIMVLLILYYTYKWVTVPWNYYESARSRRIINQNSRVPLPAHMNDEKKALEIKRKQIVARELRQHELIGLLWVLASPIIAGLTLQYSRRFLSNQDKYLSSFNIVVFVLAALIKPTVHCMSMLKDRTLYLQSEMQTEEGEVEILRERVYELEDELQSLKKAFATKKDLGQVTNGIGPTLNQLAKSVKRSEKREQLLRNYSEERFNFVDAKMREFDDYIAKRMEQDRLRTSRSLIASLIFLPMTVTLWTLKRVTHLLPLPKTLLLRSTLPPKPIKAYHDLRSTPPIDNRNQNLIPDATDLEREIRYRRQMNNDPIESSYMSGEESVAAFGRGLQ